MKKTKKISGNAMKLPIKNADDLVFWSEMIVFLNKNKGKNLSVQMDGVSYSLCAS